MRVLDANFLVDYLDGVEATREYYEANGGRDERWLVPVPAYAETLVGVGNVPGGDVEAAIENLRGWRSTTSTRGRRPRPATSPAR